MGSYEGGTMYEKYADEWRDIIAKDEQTGIVGYGRYADVWERIYDKNYRTWRIRKKEDAAFESFETRSFKIADSEEASYLAELLNTYEKEVKSLCNTLDGFKRLCNV